MVPTITSVGDQALLVEFEDSISIKTNNRVKNLMTQLEENQEEWVVDLVPSYRSLIVMFNPMLSERTYIKNYLLKLIEKSKNVDQSLYKLIKIPTLYGSDFGMDLEFVAKHNNLTSEEVISLHSALNYRIYMIGFAPGFPYLGGLNQKLITPRLDSPRLKIPGGSVGIAESQTGIYPNDSPGGWQLIGRTPLNLFDPHSEQPSLLITGDYIKFEPLESIEAYFDIRNDVESNNYKPETHMLDIEPKSHE
jgi:KipI family sensor histidine kinase inhibitor